MDTTCLSELVRPNVLKLKPYHSARHDYSDGILLDANENPIGASINESDSLHRLNRYPDPFQKELKFKIAVFRHVNENQIFIGNGSDEAIDILFRVFCEPRVDSVLITPPTYGMYSVQASIHDTKVIKSHLTTEFQLNMLDIELKLQEYPKIVWLCSPGNPTGTLLTKSSIIHILNRATKSIVVVDEAYIDFCSDNSCIGLLDKHPNLVILQTLSKSFGLAGLRLGFAITHPDIINYMNKIKAPYNLSQLTISTGLKAFSEDSISTMRSNVATIKSTNNQFREWLNTIACIRILDKNNANFVLIQLVVNNQPNNDLAVSIYKSLAQSNIIVRYRGTEVNCEACLRITIGTAVEMQQLKSLLLDLLKL